MHLTPKVSILNLEPVEFTLVPRGEKMLYSGTDPESYITEYTLVYEENQYSTEYSPPIRTGAVCLIDQEYAPIPYMGGII